MGGSLLDRIARRAVAESDAFRRVHPERFIGAADGLGPDFLYVQNVAAMLGCNVDYVRRIPRHALPASRVGQRLIYSRQDVEAFIRSQRDAGALPAPVAAGRATGCKISVAEVITFNPVEMVRQHTRGNRE